MSETIKREWKTLPEPNKIVTCDKQDRVLATVERRKSGDWHWQVHPLFGYGLLNYQGIEPKKELAMRAAEKAIEGEELQRDIQRLSLIHI